MTHQLPNYTYLDSSAQGTKSDGRKVTSGGTSSVKAPRRAR